MRQLHVAHEWQRDEAKYRFVGEVDRHEKKERRHDHPAPPACCCYGCGAVQHESGIFCFKHQMLLRMPWQWGQRTRTPMLDRWRWQHVDTVADKAGFGAVRDI